MTQPKHIILWQRVENDAGLLPPMPLPRGPLADGRATEQGSEPHPTAQNAGPR